MAKRKQWTQATLEESVNMVRNGSLTCYRAAKKYNIPLSTIRRRVMGFLPLKCRSGPPNALSTIQENSIATYARSCASAGFPVVVSKLCQMAYHTSVQSKKKCFFGTNDELLLTSGHVYL